MKEENRDSRKKNKGCGFVSCDHTSGRAFSGMIRIMDLYHDPPKVNGLSSAHWKSVKAILYTATL